MAANMAAKTDICMPQVIGHVQRRIKSRFL